MIVELKIDGQKVNMNQKGNIAATHSIADIEDPDSTTAGYTKSVEVPLIGNMRIFRFTNELYNKEQFNNEQHKAEYIVGGNTVMSGIAQIDKITYVFGQGKKLLDGSYHVSVIGAAFDWITNAKKQINELESVETVKYTLDDVYANSIREDASLIKFFPVDRGAFWEEKGEQTVARIALDIRDYHPFINVWKLMELIFQGYTIQTSIRETLQKLYCSGYMPEIEDLTYLKEENDFWCGSTSADTSFFSKYTFSINLFNKWSHTQEDDDEYFESTEGLLTMIGRGFTIFRPTVRMPIGFNLNMDYSTTVGENGCYYGLLTFSEPGYSIPLTPMDSEEAKYPSENNKLSEADNQFVCFRFSGDHAYKALHLRCDYVMYVDDPDDPNIPAYPVYKTSTQVLSDNLSKSEDFIYVPSELISRMSEGIMGGHIEELHLYFATNDGRYIDIDSAKDAQTTVFKLTDYHTLTFSKNVPIPAFTISPDNGLSLRIRLDKIYTSIDHSDMDKYLKIELGKCDIKPDFRNAIGIGDDVNISTVGGTTSQIDFLAAIRQMYNLMFYTNPVTREVFLESRTKFFNMDRADVLDWRYKIDYSKSIEVEELGCDIGNELKLAYADGNEVVTRYNWKNRTELGAYISPLLNKTADETKEVVNTMFAPFLLRTVESVGMTIPQNESEKTQDQIGEVDLDITPIIGRFAGLAIRTGGENIVGMPIYPRLVFQDAGISVNLGFEDLQAEIPVPGLNQYYQDNISAYNYGRRITLYLQLTPQDIEAILMPNAQMQDFRAVFLLNFDGEDVPCLLEQIADYNPATGASTKCVFVSDPNIKLTGDDLAVITYDDVAIGRNNTLLGY